MAVVQQPGPHVVLKDETIGEWRDAAAPDRHDVSRAHRSQHTARGASSPSERLPQHGRTPPVNPAPPVGLCSHPDVPTLAQEFGNRSF